MVLQTLPSVALPNLRVRAVSGHAKNLIVIFRLAPLQRHFRLFQLSLQRPHLRVARVVVRLGLVDSRLEIGNALVEMFQMEINARARTEGLK